MKIVKFNSLLLIMLLFAFADKGKAQTWSPVGGGIYGMVNSLIEFNGDLYAGGKFAGTGSGLASKLAKWNGVNWSALGTGPDDDVNALAIFNGELYAAGKFLNVGGVPANRIAKWDGTLWSAVGTGMDDMIRALAVDTVNHILYAAGDFSTAGGVSAHSVAKWDGTSWSPLSSIVGTIETMAMYNNQLFIGGNFGAGGSTNLAIWNGTAWSNAGIGTGMTGNVHALYVHNSKLYIGGGFDHAATVAANYIATWDGTTFAPLGGGMDIAGGGSGSGHGVKAIVEFNSDIYAGGEFLTAEGNPAKYIAKWNGSNWDSVSAGMNNFVYALCAHNSKLFAGGTFTTAGSVSTYYIAQWGPLTTGIENNSADGEFSVYPNPSHGEFQVSSTKAFTEIRISNLLGANVYTLPANGTQATLDLQGLSKGIYIYQLMNKNESLKSGKLVIE